MIDQTAVTKAASLIGEARLAHQPMDSLPLDCRPQSEADGYLIQAALHDWFCDAGLGARAGFKIGCTTSVMQSLLGIDSPAYGGVMAANMHVDRPHFRLSHFQRLGVECEVAVRMSADLTPDGAPYDRPDVAEAVADCMVAMEIVDNRYGADFASDVPRLIADDFFHAACVLGSPIGDWRGIDFAAATCTTIIDGGEAASGVGADVMGHPFEALAWLANKLAAQGRTLSAGEIVLTGSVPAVQWIEDRQAEAIVSVAGLGDVAATFGAR